MPPRDRTWKRIIGDIDNGLYFSLRSASLTATNLATSRCWVQRALPIRGITYCVTGTAGLMSFAPTETIHISLDRGRELLPTAEIVFDCLGTGGPACRHGIAMMVPPFWATLTSNIPMDPAKRHGSFLRVAPQLHIQQRARLRPCVC